MQTESAFSIENAVGQLINNVGTKPEDQNHNGASGGKQAGQQSPANNPPKK